MTQTLDEIIDRVEVLGLQPGDSLVISAVGPISAEAAHRLMDHLSSRLGYSVPIIVLDEGARLSVLRPAVADLPLIELPHPDDQEEQ